MQILLTTINVNYIHQNLAIRILYELNKHYKGLEWKEFTCKDNLDEIGDYYSNYEVVAFSCYIWNITKVLQVCKIIKQKNPICKILLGGPEVSYDWNDIICCSEIDYIIAGEGEISFSEFLNNYPRVENVSGLIWKNNGEVIENKKPNLFNIQEFNMLNPYLNESSELLKSKICYIETSRGCPFSCEFCLAGLDNSLRFFPIENIKQNLLYLMKYGKKIKFLDRTFNSKKSFSIDIFKFILENHQPENVFQFEIKADFMHPELIEFLESEVPSGLFRFEIGIQTINQKSNSSVGRKQSFDKIKEVIERLSGKIEMHLDLIVGLPYDYWADIKYSFENVFRLFASELQLGFLKFLKGTEVRYNTDLHEYRYDLNPPYQILESIYLSAGEIEKISLVEHMLEMYWNKKRTVRTLKYIANNYSIFDFLLNLGIYFKSKLSLYNYNLSDIYKIINEFIEFNYGNDKILKELIVVDYYMQHKIKPQNIFNQEVSKILKNRLIESLKLNHHKYRFVVLQLSFALAQLEKKNRIENELEYIIIQYDGVNTPILIQQPSEH